ncbi:MAG: Rrf2 family transcriptional regulator [Desulfobacterales bacterium]
MLITQKNKYALRAVFELAKRRNQGPVKIVDIAAAQKIPVKFLEVILNQLKHGGVVESKRGFQGGYALIRPPDELTVGDILRQIESPESLHCVSCISRDDCALKGDCAFLPMWTKAQKAMVAVFDTTTIQDLINSAP